MSARWFANHAFSDLTTISICGIWAGFGDHLHSIPIRTLNGVHADYKRQHVTHPAEPAGGLTLHVGRPVQTAVMTLQVALFSW
ncbi:hypothetical protein BN1723_010162 [Verticillium longisporum]|uniref:Uncharacterized protein n=1 Tax=Verticillium longisporum TaxID=100787 RepID=A0A0G4KVS6_VERLO|nr:hypothetical protein BN1723_010162 [Verticillium longisporum]